MKQLLTDEKEGLQNILKRCPVTKLNKDKDYPEYMLSIAERKAQRQPSSKHLDPNLNYPSGTPVDKILELQIRDLILEMEEKVYLGTLGSLKVIIFVTDFLRAISLCSILCTFDCADFL